MKDWREARARLRHASGGAAPHVSSAGSIESHPYRQEQIDTLQ